MKRFAAIATAIFALAALVCSCDRKIEKGPINVLLITVDTLRGDHIAAAGYEFVETPNIDRMISEGAYFDQVRVAVPVTLPSHSTILTGLYPPAHGVRDNGSFRLPDEITTIPEIFKANGYDTSAIIGAVVLDRRFGLAQGFDLYDDAGFAKTEDDVAFFYPERKATEVTDHALKWLEDRSNAKKKPDAKFFMWAHYYDPHAKYDPPPPFKEKYSNSPYDGEIAYTDEQIGRLVEGAKKFAGDGDLLVVLTSDHGEGLFEHGESTHGIFLYDSTVRVPLILYCPDRLKPMKSSARVGSVDIAPTILELAGLRGGEAMQGRSLLPVIEGNPEDRAVYMESAYARYHYGWSELRGMSADGYTVIESPRPELYSWDDADQEIDLADKEQGKVETFLKRLNVWLKELYRHDIFVKAKTEMSPEVQAQMNAVGYVSFASKKNSTAEAPAISGINPADRKYFQSDFAKAITLAAGKKYDEAIAIVDNLIEQNPGSPFLFETKAVLLEAKGDRVSAKANYLLSVEADPEFAGGWRGLGRMYLIEKKYDDAVAAIGRAIELYSTDVEAFSLMGAALRAKGDNEAAAQFYLRAVVMAPGLPETNRDYGIFLYRVGRYDEAAKYLGKALELAPFELLAMTYMGKVKLKTGDRAGGIALLQAVVAKDPRATDTYVNLAEALETGEDGVLYGEGADLENAAKLCERALEIEPGYEPARKKLDALKKEMTRRGK